MAVPYAFANVTTTQNLSYLDANFNYFGNAITVQATSTAMTISSSGKIGIGTSSPANKLDVVSATSARIGLSSTGSTQDALINFNNTGGNAYVGLDNSTGGLGGPYSLNLWHGGAYPIVFATNNLESMRIDSSGNLMVGTTSNINNSKLVVNGSISTISTQVNMYSNNSGATFDWVLRTGSTQSFYVNNASVVATLSSTGVWTNASDSRYKENIVDSTYGLNAVMALKPRAYNLIDQADKFQIGFIAQEVLEVVPEIVDSVHNSITKEDRYTLSYGQLTAVLAKAIQEQQALITELKIRIATLETK